MKLVSMYPLEPRRLMAASMWPSSTISGTDGPDVIFVDNFDGHIITVNGVTRTAPARAVLIYGMAGNDKIVVQAAVLERIAISGGGGNDTIVGGSGDDELSGANGKDKVFGGAGNDYLLGAAQNDYLNGELSADTCSGGGGNDRLIGISGPDYLLGGAGDDVFVSRDSSVPAVDPDTVSGGLGFDRAQVDEADIRTSIAELIP